MMNWKKFLLFNIVVIILILVLPYIVELIINGSAVAHFFITVGGGEFIVFTISGFIFFNFYFIINEHWKNFNKKASFILLLILIFLFVPFIHPEETGECPEFVGATCDSCSYRIAYSSMRGTDLFFYSPFNLKSFDDIISGFGNTTVPCSKTPILGLSYFFISIPLSLLYAYLTRKYILYF